MQYDFAVAAGQVQVIEVAGKFFKYRSGIGTIRVRASGGGYVDLLPGQGVWNTEYTRLEVKDISGAANMGVLLAGAYDFHDDRITGSVEVIDGGRSRTLANQAFDGSVYAAPLAGNLALTQLFNPANSGKRVVVKRITGSSAQGGAIGIVLINTALANGGAGAPSKLAGGAPSTAQLRTENRVAAPAGSFSSISPAAGVSVDRVYQEPIVLLPGYGLVMWTNTPAAETVGAYEFYEEQA